MKLNGRNNQYTLRWGEDKHDSDKRSALQLALQSQHSGAPFFHVWPGTTISMTIIEKSSSLSSWLSLSLMRVITAITDVLGCGGVKRGRGGAGRVKFGNKHVGISILRANGVNCHYNDWIRLNSCCNSVWNSLVLWYFFLTCHRQQSLSGCRLTQTEFFRLGAKNLSWLLMILFRQNN